MITLKKDLAKACQLIVKYRGFYADLKNEIFVERIYLNDGEHIDVKIGNAKDGKELVLRVKTSSSKIIHYRPNEKWESYILNLASDISEQIKNIKTPNQVREEAGIKEREHLLLTNNTPI